MVMMSDDADGGDDDDDGDGDRDSVMVADCA